MNTINELLKSLDACDEAREWASNKIWEEIHTQCHRGDWLLWLFQRTNPGDLQRLTLAKGHCANTVRHLIKDERSIRAVDTAIQFGEGLISLNQLTADAAAYAAYADAAAYAAARKQNQQLTADICRQYLPIEIWDIKYDTK